jgi:hypothetical protein
VSLCGVEYAAVAVWELAKSESSRSLFGAAGAVTVLLQWSGSLARHIASHVRTSCRRSVNAVVTSCVRVDGKPLVRVYVPRCIHSIMCC